MNKYTKIADGLASWVNFELRAGRKSLFSESYLAHPVGQLLNYRFSGRVLSEVEHPVLSEAMTGPGKRPRIDFVVKSKEEKFELAIETKWVSESPTLLRDIIIDVVRLDLLVPNYANEAILILAGNKRDMKKLFDHPQFLPCPNHPNSSSLLAVEDDYEKTTIRFVPVPQFRRDLLTGVLKSFNHKNIEVSKKIQTERSGPFPKNCNADQYEVYIWKIRNFNEVEKFKPSDFYSF